jgi:hypothetical protein
MRFVDANRAFDFAVFRPSANCCTIDIEEFGYFRSIQIRLHSLTIKDLKLKVNREVLHLLQR